MAFDLSGKVALVTGGAKGIGRDAARTLAQQGAQVVISDIAPEGIETACGRAIRHDVASEQDWCSVIASVNAQEGRLDVLVNNAGVILNRSFLATSLEDFRRVHRINVESVWLGMQAAADLMTQSARTTAGGSIINLSSVYGQIVGPMHAAYCASKGAVRLLTKAVAVEFARGRTGIRVNSVHPGPIETDLGLSGVDAAVSAGIIPDAQVGKAAVAAQFPMGRWGRADDVSGAILFLASDASKFLTGAELTVDGGYAIV